MIKLSEPPEANYSTAIGMTDIIRAADPPDGQMILIIQKIKTYIQPLCRRKGIQFNFYADEK